MSRVTADILAYISSDKLMQTFIIIKNLNLSYQVLL